ncbi:MAG: hypothetical protein EBZ67_05935 [Chitinophagia bacterium]|nr:hypothetical protein [Chitinophagia bacterium]
MIDILQGSFVTWIQAILFLFMMALFLLPGIVARSTYFTFPFSEGARTRERIPDAFWTLVIGTCIEVVWIWAHRQLTGSWVSTDELLVLLTGRPDGELETIMLRNMAEMRLELLVFLCMPLAAAALLGELTRRLVLRTDADIRIPLLRYSNKWYYILSGKMQEVEGRLRPLPRGVNFVRVEVLCREGDRHVIYSGQVTEFKLLPGDKIHSFRIRHPFRRFPESAPVVSDTPGMRGFEAMDVPQMRFLQDDIIDLQPFYYEIKPFDAPPA